MGDERTPDGGEIFTSAPAREQLMRVTTDDQPNLIVLTVVGAVDALTAPRLRDALREAFARLAGRLLVVDLTSVEFLGSAGLRTLAAAAREASAHAGYRTMRVVVDHARPVLRPIEIVGLDGVLAMYHDLPAALHDDEIHDDDPTA